uniref:guanylate cyclase n=1 Tax=Strigamia maritima TaxID=126957 RepID=T1IU04_STRMM
MKNEDMHLDSMFKASLVADLLKGMTYIHDSEIISHGNLNPRNCLVDSRWVLQISDYGLHEFKGTHENRLSTTNIYQRKFLWRAPELLRNPSPPARGSQKGDVYSFGFILHELIGKNGPWGNIPLSHKEILDRVIDPSQYNMKRFRPSTQDLNCPDYIVWCMQDCWNEDPDERPDFRLVRVKLKEMQVGL